MNHLEYVTCGTCSRLITIDVDAAGIIRNLSFLGGCSGNLKGICALAIGKPATEIKNALKGITCGSKAQVVRTSLLQPWSRWATNFGAVVTQRILLYNKQGIYGDKKLENH